MVFKGEGLKVGNILSAKIIFCTIIQNQSYKKEKANQKDSRHKYFLWSKKLFLIS